MSTREGKYVESYVAAYSKGSMTTGIGILFGYLTGTFLQAGNQLLFMMFGLGLAYFLWKHIKNTNYFRSVDISQNIGKTDEIDDITP